jgi:hypothetical protein
LENRIVKNISNHSFFGTKQNIMKILMYSIYAFDKPFIEKCDTRKIRIEYTNQPLNEDTVKLAEGFEGISIFTTDNASDTTGKNYIYVSDILPYAL